ncbi:unnamed protein product, partial [Amoebophrya sp. A25]
SSTPSQHSRTRFGLLARTLLQQVEGVSSTLVRRRVYAVLEVIALCDFPAFAKAL